VFAQQVGGGNARKNAHRADRAARLLKTHRLKTNSALLPKSSHCLALAIRNTGESADIKVITLKELFGRRTVKCLEIPRYAYT